jgi:alpha-1,2-mannosyltransferase
VKPVAPALLRLRLTFVAQAVLVGAALAIYAIVLIQAGPAHQDFGVYLGAARDLWHGQPLYAAFLHHPFPDPTLRPAYIYPPAFAVLVAPLGLLPDLNAGIVWTLIEQAALAAALVIVLRRWRPSAWAVTALLCATFTFYPLWVDAVQGQANLLVLLLVTAGITGIAAGHPRAGAALGAAAALKLTPVILLVWLLVDRRFREAAWMVAGIAAVTGVGAIVRFHDTLVFFGQVVPALASGTAYYANQSLAGIVRRVLTSNPYTQPWTDISWAFLVVAVLTILLTGWWFWQTRGQPALVRSTAFIPLLPLASAVTWSHHLVILLPLIWLAAVALAGRAWPVAPTLVLAGVLVFFDVVSRWPVGPQFNQPGFRLAQTADPIVFLAANSLFFATLILFLAAPWLLRSR